MNLKTAFLGLISCTAASAFSPMSPNGVEVNPTWRAPMKMAAGGAERAYGQEYYEGASVCCAVFAVLCLYLYLID